MANERLRTTVLGFALTFAVFAALFYFAGTDRLVSQLQMAETSLVVAVVGITLLWLSAWSLSLKVVLDVLGVDVSAVKTFFIFAGAMFSNNITPFGQAGGEPVTALLISRTADAEYETGLAAIASVDTLNFVPSITIALFGAGYFVTETTLVASDSRIEMAVIAIVALAVAVPGILYLGWQNRYEIERRAIRRLTPTIRWVTEKLPRVSVPTAESIEGRVNRFFRAIERVATNRRGLALALGLSALGWFCQMVALWVAFQAIGVPIKLSLAMFVVPIGAIAGVTPLPGGAGGIEWVLATLLAAATGPAIGFATATAAVIVYRGAVYWVPTLLGGAVMGVLSVRGRA
ncbi:hypothetical protein SAMN04487949_3059 [Halogranum gelatinilyticum]|uniref:Lysylphosphatidylglycerol synthase TM region n=1 Tax=Halogranum gelatinilyticum TaxID=660521 RepID=A0A1G9XPJ9_9EURY|nr:flippase-like domain-containing protein [Halogranum gelatinilyticum]SDM98173.1 hypothetical protein SAMN04487949_3059 [Halogranum gelatinilyticum]